MTYPPFTRLFEQSRGPAKALRGYVTPEEQQVAFLRGERVERPWLSPLDFGIGFRVDVPVEGPGLHYDPATQVTSLDIAAKGLSLHALRQQVGRNGLADVWRFLGRHQWP